MAADTCGEFVKIDYSHPEILPADILLRILKERKVFESELDALDKYKLVELFYDHIMPLPQRIYGDGRREQRLAKRQICKDSLKRKCEPDNTDGNSKKMCSVRSNSLNCASRLKPPPSDKNGCKIVKLSSSEVSPYHCPSNNSSSKEEISNKDQLPDISLSKKRKFQPISWP